MLEGTYEEEQRQYYLLSSIWMELNESQCPGNSITLLKLDLNTCTLSDVQGIPETPFSIHVPKYTWVSGFSGWFTVDFLGNESFRLPNFVRLCTGPKSGPSHWGQQVGNQFVLLKFKSSRCRISRVLYFENLNSSFIYHRCSIWKTHCILKMMAKKKDV